MFGSENCKFCQWLAANSDVPLRAVLAITFILHGYPKVFEGGAAHMADGFAKGGMPAPVLMAWSAAIAEFGGGILIAIGLLTRLAALGHLVVMAVAIATVHFKQGYMHKAILLPDGKPATQGWEWQLALGCIALALVMRGAGPLSLDKTLLKNCCKKKEPQAPPGV